jgi:hypothetical protein
VVAGIGTGSIDLVRTDKDNYTKMADVCYEKHEILYALYTNQLSKFIHPK